MLRSVDHAIYLAQTYGPFTRYYSSKITAGTTAATTTSGYTSIGRFPHTITVPTVGSALSGMVLTYCRMLTSIGDSTLCCGIETTLGTLTVSGNSFAAGSSMPTKIIKDTSITTAASLVMVYISVSTVLTTPTLTITYTNQAGTGSRTATMTIPTNALVNSCFLLQPHLQAGDTGIRAVTNMSLSSGTSGTIVVIGVLPLAYSSCGLSALVTGPDPVIVPTAMFPVAATNVIAFYRNGSALAGEIRAVLSGVADI